MHRRLMHRGDQEFCCRGLNVTARCEPAHSRTLRHSPPCSETKVSRRYNARSQAAGPSARRRAPPTVEGTSNDFSSFLPLFTNAVLADRPGIGTVGNEPRHCRPSARLASCGKAASPRPWRRSQPPWPSSPPVRMRLPSDTAQRNAAAMHGDLGDLARFVHEGDVLLCAHERRALAEKNAPRSPQRPAQWGRTRSVTEMMEACSPPGSKSLITW